jgi:hypothetical protein
MIIYYTKLHLFKFYGSCVVSLKQNMNLTFNGPPHSYIWFPTKTVSTKVIHPLKIYKHTQFHGYMLTGASFVSTSEV